MKEHIKQEIYEKLGKMEQRNGAKIASLTDRTALTDYRDLARPGEHGKIWTDALQTALNEHVQQIKNYTDCGDHCRHYGN